MVRIARLPDLPKILPMMVEFNREEAIAWEPQAGERALAKLLGSPQLGLVGLLEDSQSLFGYFVVTWGFDLEWRGRDAFLTELYVVPERRGQGYGAAALEAVEDVARQSEARALHLLVRRDNAVAQQLYREAGYTAPPRDFLSKPL